MNKIHHKDISKSIAYRKPTSFDELLCRFDKYIIQEIFKMVFTDHDSNGSDESDEQDDK